MASPAAELVADTAAGAVRTVIPVVSGLVPGSGPLVDPIADALTGVSSLPTVATLPPAASASEVPAVDPVGAATASPGSPGVATAAGIAPPESGATPTTSRHQALPSAWGPGASSEAREPANDLPADEVPGAVPAIPGSGAASSQPGSGPGSYAAAETTAFELRPPPGMCETRHPLQAAPEPVSFDPGSSPD
ncbi:hypothetical protein ABLI39_17070 [Pseudarthrobacter sp. B907]|uniref:hypothetical protein n=1 Tax=Pseudarthrobacter sp. B907 TaxID=3158261 RepID=UPI0032DAF853